MRCSRMQGGRRQLRKRMHNGATEAASWSLAADLMARVGVAGKLYELHPGGGRYDIVVAGDVIEHLSRPSATLRQIREVLRPGGQLLLSVPNFGHWYPRVRVATGLFGYDRRGILDDTHLRFFTRSTLRRMVRAAGFDVVEEIATGLPLGAVGDGAHTGVLYAIRRIDEALVKLRPTFFGYQYILRLTPYAEEAIHAEDLKLDRGGHERVQSA